MEGSPFGNGELANVKDLRLKLTYYTSNLSLFLNMVSMGSMGMVEKQMYEAGGDLKDIRRAVNGITAHLMSGANKEGSVLTDYADDDKAVWRAFRRELVKGGFSSDVIREHKDTIQAYVQELGSRGILDDEDLKDSGNVSEQIEGTTPAQATPQSRDKVLGSFEHETGAARDDIGLRTGTTGSFEHRTGAARESLNPLTGTTGHVDVLSEIVNQDARVDQTVPQQTQPAPTLLKMNNISDTLPCTTQADAEIVNVVETDSQEPGKVDDMTNRHRSSAPIPSAQRVPEIAEEETWILRGKTFKHGFHDYNYNLLYCSSRGFVRTLTQQNAIFEATRDRFVAWGETLEFQDEAKGFLKVAEVRTWTFGSDPAGKSFLRLSPLFEDPSEHPLNHEIANARPRSIINRLLQHALCHIDARPEKWRITKLPSPRETTKGERYKDGGKGKSSTAPPQATPAVVEDT